MTKEEEIADLESQLTGDMFADMDIKDQIHKLKLEEAGGICSIDDPECEACGLWKFFSKIFYLKNIVISEYYFKN